LVVVQPLLLVVVIQFYQLLLATVVVVVHHLVILILQLAVDQVAVVVGVVTKPLHQVFQVRVTMVEQVTLAARAVEAAVLMRQVKQALAQHKAEQAVVEQRHL
jgi:hypothetical protein